MKKYRINENEAAFLRLLHSSFAGLHLYLEMIEQTGRKMTKKQMLKAIKEVLGQTGIAVDSEYIRGQLILKGVISNDNKDIALCTFDPSDDNEELVVEVYTKDELMEKRIKASEPTWKNSVKGR